MGGSADFGSRGESLLGYLFNAMFARVIARVSEKAREGEQERVIFWVIACEVLVRCIFLFISKFRDVGLCEITLNKFCSNCFTIWLTSNLISLKVRYFLFKYQK